MEQEHRDRWLHGRQNPRFAPFTIERRFLHVDSIVGPTDARQYSITIGRNAYGRDSALIVRDADGRVAHFQAGLAPYRRRGPAYPRDSARMANFRRFRSGGVLALIDTRVWDLVLPFPRIPSAGLQWTDTVAREATDGPYRQLLSGTRTSRIVGDTTVAGRRFWIVRDSAALRYAEQFLEEERTLDTTVLIERTTSGVERGTHLFDPELGLFRWRVDTLSLAGVAILQYPDGRSFRSPARYERSRKWVLHDAAGYAARRSALRAAQSRQFGGMVRTPSTEIERRLSLGDQSARDSILGEWRRATDPNEFARLFQLLTMWSRDAESRRSLDSMRIAAGDTVFVYRHLASGITSSPIDTADLRMMVPFMEDPGIAWGFNMSRDWLYENLAQALRTSPPGAVAHESDRSACIPEACRMLAEWYRSARERRTRDVGLVALFAADPARWADTLLSESRAGRPVLRAAALLARGVGSTWVASSKDPVPAPDSDWHAWLEWMNGTDSAYAAARSAVAELRGVPVDTVRRPRFEDSHRVALRLYMKRTGRNIVAELRRGYETAPSDRARLVFGTMLQGMGEVLMTPAQVAEEFRSGNAERARLARLALVQLFRDAQPMDRTRAIPIIDRLIAATVDLWPLWPAGAADLNPASARRPELHAGRGRVRLVADNIPVELYDKWSKKLDFLDANDRRQLDPREATVVYTIRPVTTIGPFARIQIDAAEQVARSADEAPAHFASSVTYYLMQRDDEWVIVATEGWVT